MKYIGEEDLSFVYNSKIHLSNIIRFNLIVLKDLTAETDHVRALIGSWSG